jgi:hypothetical protein
MRRGFRPGFRRRPFRRPFRPIFGPRPWFGWGRPWGWGWLAFPFIGVLGCLLISLLPPLLGLPIR